MPTADTVKPEAQRRLVSRLRGVDGHDHSLHASAGETATVVVFVLQRLSHRAGLRGAIDRPFRTSGARAESS